MRRRSAPQIRAGLGGEDGPLRCRPAADRGASMAPSGSRGTVLWSKKVLAALRRGLDLRGPAAPPISVRTGSSAAAVRFRSPVTVSSRARGTGVDTVSVPSTSHRQDVSGASGSWIVQSPWIALWPVEQNAASTWLAGAKTRGVHGSGAAGAAVPGVPQPSHSPSAWRSAHGRGPEGGMVASSGSTSHAIRSACARTPSRVSKSPGTPSARTPEHQPRHEAR